MLSVYFDRNVFADICEFRNNITQNDIGVIKKAVESKKISILFSSALLAETSALLQKSDKEFLEQITTVFSLVDKEKMAKQNDSLLMDDCISFAHLAPFERTVPLNDQARKFMASPKIDQRLVQFGTSHPRAMKEGAKSINEAISSQRKNMADANLKLPSDFFTFWEKHSIEAVRRLVIKLPENVQKLCAKRGIEKMLEIRSLRLYTVHHAWFFYSGLRGVQNKPRKITSNDFVDFIHTIESSAAEIFVTQENKSKANRIPYILNQIKYADFQIISLSEFLEYLKQFK